MEQGFVLIGLFSLIALVFPFAGYLVSWLLRPKRPNPVKQSPYECGLEPIGEPWVRLRIPYYTYALLFLIFEVEVVFLYPWAVAYHQLGLFALAETVLFVGILTFGLIYLWKKGALRWM